MSSQSESATLHNEADCILYEKGLLTTLEAFGTPHTTGSYALDLMTWRDLDLYLETAQMSEERFFNLGGRLATTLLSPQMLFRNERLAQTNGLPQGLYWRGQYRLLEHQVWKIYIWCVSNQECLQLLRHCEDTAKRLTPDPRKASLHLKAACWEHSEYRFGFSSQDIYTAVLTHGIATVERFREYLQKKKGISL